MHLTKIQHHVTGVKVHSSNRTNIFTWTDLFHSDSNITMNCLVHVLEEICKVITYTIKLAVLGKVKFSHRVLYVEKLQKHWDIRNFHNWCHENR